MKTYLTNSPVAVSFRNGKVQVDIEDEFDLTATSPRYSLLYTKLNGATDTYKINNIVYMDNNILKAVVEGKGYRSFRTDRVISLIPE